MADIDSYVRYANSDSIGLYTSQIGWFDYSPYCINKIFENNKTYSVINTIRSTSLYTVSFNLKIKEDFPDFSRYDPVTPRQPPVYKEAVFGNVAYVGIKGNVCLYMLRDAVARTTYTIYLNDIQVKDSSNSLINDYEIITADSEATNKNESWEAYTDGQPWNIMQVFPPINENNSKIHIVKIGNTFKYTGTTLNDAPSISLSSASPRNVSVTLSTLRGNQSAVLGIIIPSSIKNKRINSTKKESSYCC